MDTRKLQASFSKGFVGVDGRLTRHRYYLRAKDR